MYFMLKDYNQKIKIPSTDSIIQPQPSRYRFWTFDEII